MSLIFLSSEQIEYLIDFIKPQKGIPIKTANSLVELNKNSFRKQLTRQQIYPELLPKLKATLFKTWKDSLIQPGESVGVICAQSIGEKNTQTALNTFHKAGQSEKTMTEGVPRFQELLNATKNPKIVNHKIFFKHGCDTIQELRKTVSNTLAGCTIKDLSLSVDIMMDKKREEWYGMFEKLFNKDLGERKDCICIKLHKKKIYEYKIRYSDIAKIIEDIYDDLICVFSPFGDGLFYIYPDTRDIESKIPETIAYITPENAIEIYLEDVVQPNLEGVHICGIEGITELFYTKNKNEWYVETNADNNDPDRSNNFNKILALKQVDEFRTVSNNIWEIYRTLGIEATKNFLVEEFMNIMEGINICHAKLLVDRMTFNGSIDSISRYTLKSDECGPMGKASFEESLDNFLNAASAGEVEPTRGISASIICGKRSNTGTGMMGLKLDKNIF